MSKKSKIEAELLKATGLKGPKTDEKPQAYFERLIRKVQGLEDDEWEALETKTQAWVNAGAKAIKADKKVAPFPDLKGGDDDDAEDDDEDDKPKKKSSKKNDDEDDEDDAEDDEEEDDAPKKKKKKKDEEEDDESGKSRRRKKDDDDEDDEDDEKSKKSKKSRKKDEGDDDEEEDDDMAKKAKKKNGKKDDDKKAAKKPRGSGAQALIKTMVITNPKVTAEKIMASLEKKGLETTESSVSSIRAGTLQTLRLVKEHGMPKGEI
jgi:hypothetical protein